MADGASDKAAARQMGISFHAAKFHVTAIVEKSMLTLGRWLS